jgi:hypothetical protein
MKAEKWFETQKYQMGYFDGTEEFHQMYKVVKITKSDIKLETSKENLKMVQIVPIN